MAAQSYKNHTRFDPSFHFFFVPLALICFIGSIVHVVGSPSPANVLLVPVTFCVLLGGGLARMYANKVQDRIIRLEEQTRLRRLGGDPDGLSMRQLIALRFAADGEVVALATRVKADNLSSQQIKQAVVQWRPDEYRV